LTSDLLDGITENGRNTAGLIVGVNEGWALEAITAFPADGEVSVAFLDVGWLGNPVPGQPSSQLIGGVQQPGIPGFGGEQDQLTKGHNPTVVFSSPEL